MRRRVSSAAATIRAREADSSVRLCLLDRSGYEVVGQAGDGTQLLALAREVGPDLVVADIRMPPTHTTEGLEAALVIRQERPDTAILVLSAYVEVQHAMELLAGGGGTGYLLKSRIADVEEFLDALQRIARGGSVVDPALVRELVTARRREDPLAALSAREHEVLTLMADWPPVTGPATASGVTGTFATITRSDGSVQAIFDGHPLYTFVGDTAPGQAKGNGLNAFGGLWHEITTSGTAPAGSSSSGSGGGGGGY
jgi:DNA-binding NarL/FixJ family response regulator